MARRSDHTREELKDMILQSAWGIIGQEGFEGLTARKIAKDVGYAPGTIYNLFDSLDDLYLLINSRTLDHLNTVLNSEACNDPGKNPVDNMKAMAALYMQFARECRPYWLMLFSPQLPEVRKDYSWYQEKIDQLFLPLERQLCRNFPAKEPKQCKMAARLLWASVHGLCFLQETGKIPLVGGQSQADEMADYLIDTFLAGINHKS